MSPAATDDATVAALVLALAEEELRLVRDDDPSLLAELHDRRRAAMDVLPSAISPAARALLERAVAVQHEVDEALEHSMGVVQGELRLLARGQRLAHGYTPARPARPVLDAVA